ncbi:MAG: hypothetical protein A2521_00745 [Deltaproteobacteria bacterium RIFOXYD12_FULL_57_12]|nr:MAG: hypothetical protein A2521_00745 [Deltaproteobacteria bacterium RIFOXYD12_FULL_57_12]
MIDFAVRIIRTAETLPKTKIGNHGPKGQNFMIRNSLFDILFKNFNYAISGGYREVTWGQAGLMQEMTGCAAAARFRVSERAAFPPG